MLFQDLLKGKQYSPDDIKAREGKTTQRVGSLEVKKRHNHKTISDKTFITTRELIDVSGVMLTIVLSGLYIQHIFGVIS